MTGLALGLGVMLDRHRIDWRNKEIIIRASRGKVKVQILAPRRILAIKKLGKKVIYLLKQNLE